MQEHQRGTSKIQVGGKIFHLLLIRIYFFEVFNQDLGFVGWDFRWNFFESVVKKFEFAVKLVMFAMLNFYARVKLWSKRAFGGDYRDFIRGGPNFDPVKYVKEVSHVKHMHANLILVHFNFSSKLMVAWLKPNFGPLSNSSKTQFWSSSN